MKMDKKTDDTKIEEYEFHQRKSPISINDIDINKIVISNKFPFNKEILNISLVTEVKRNQTFMDILSRNEHI